MPSTTQRWIGGALSFFLVVLCLLVLPGVAAAQSPVVSFNNLRPDPFVGEEIVFDVSLVNGSATDTGYGPYIDLWLPTIGVDGAGAGVDDGVTFLGASYLGASVTSTTLTFDGAGNATHPYARDLSGAPVVLTGGTPGNQVIVLQLPFGSFTPGQPAAAVQVRLALSNRADLGTPLALQARGGFQFGADPLANPTTDPTIQGTAVPASITPTLLRLKKTYLGPEDETATGPNFPREYLIEVDIANGQTLADVTLMDVLPSSMQFVSVTSTTIRGTPETTIAMTTPSTTTPGGNLRRRFPSVTGTTAENDATLQFRFFIPRVNAGSLAIIDANTGDDAESDNDARASGQWTPIDPGDSQTPVTSDVVVVDHKLFDKSIAIQKSAAIVTDNGAPGATPGDVVEYTLNIQVSDYFAFRDIIVTDVIGDGLRRDATFVPRLGVTQHSGNSPSAAIDPARYSFTVNSPGNGSTTAEFHLSDELVLRGFDGRMVGGCVPAAGTGGPLPDCGAFNGGGTTATIVYRAIIQEDYSDTFPSGDSSVDAGDVMNNTVSINGSLVDVATLATIVGVEADDSAADLVIVSGQLTKAVYAINGSTSFPTPVKIMPGDTVTYQLRLTLPTSDIEPFDLTDYLPLPIFQAMTMAPTFTAVQSATPPAAGQAQFGPGDTFYALTSVVPTVLRDATANSVAFRYPQYDSPSSPSSAIEILFTVQASNDPFADKLFLTNQVRSSEKTTQNATSAKDAIVQVELTEPVLSIKKGVIASVASAVYTPSTTGPVLFNAPGAPTVRWAGSITSANLLAAPIDSNLSGVDVADLVTFAIVVENTGSSAAGAFDVALRDTMPSGFGIPGGGLNLQVRNGAGTVLPFTAIGGGLFDPAGGIRLDDTATGALASATATDGTNILVLTYDLEIQSGVAAAQELTNTATLFNYAGTEGGPDHTTTDRTDTAKVTIKTPTLSKTVVSTDQAHTSGNSVAIGEIVTYRITVTVPEGVTNNAILTDTFPLGLAMLDVTAVNTSAGVSMTTPPTTGVGTSSPVGAGADNDGRQVTWNLGTITNTDTVNGTADTITIDLRAVVTNVSANQSGQNRANAVGLTFTGGSTSANAANVTIVEPTLTFAKSAVPTSGDAGDVITFNMSVTNSSGVDAFDVTLADALPSGLTLVGGSISSNLTGGVTGSVSPSANGFTAILPQFPNGGSLTLSLSATLDASIVSGQVLTNSIMGRWTSLPGPVTTTQSTHNTLATERTGMPANPGGLVNDYQGSASANVTAVAPVPTKTVVTTNLASTSGNNLAIGEQVQYQVQVAVPEGTATGVSLVDTLPVGMVFQSLDSIVASAGVTASAGTFPAILAAAATTNAGRTVTFTLDTVTNGNSNPATETITFVYTAVVTNVGGNQSGTTLVNNAVWNFNGSNVSVNGPTMTVVEPALQISKVASPTSADADQVVTYTLTISHAAGSNSDAYEVTLTEPIPTGMTYVPGSFSSQSGVAAGSVSLVGNTLTVPYTNPIPVGQSSVVSFQARTNGMPTPVTPGQTLTNTANIAWSSYPGDITTPQTPNSVVSTERTGDTGNPGGVVNDYRALDTEPITIHTSSISGYVYVDANNDGTRTGGEAGIVGTTVMLTGTDHLGNTINLVTTTAANGAYSFTGLRPGTYRVTELQPGGYEDGRESVGTPALGATAGNDTIGIITIPAGANTTAIDFNFGELTTADLSVTKTGAPHSVAPGANISYTVEVKNLGPLTATNATLTDVLPGGTTFVSITPVAGWSCTPPAAGSHGTISCTNPAFAVGSATFTVVVQAGPTLVPGSQLRNVATITATSADTNPFNNKDDESTIVAAATEADLEVTKTDNVDPVTAGQNIVYVVTVRNHGPATTDVTVTDTLPAGLTLVSAVPATGICGNGNPLICDMGSVAAGNATTILVTASTSTPGVFTNSVTVASSNGVTDPNPTNNQAEQPTTVVDVAGTDLALTKVGPPTVARGGTLSYTITVTNRGTVAADNVEVADPLSLPGLTFTGNAGACTTAFPCALGTLAPGASATIVTTFAVDPAYSGPNPVVNTATVSTTTPDADPTNNTATVNTLVADPAAADLTIVKVDSPDAAVAGTPVTYTLVVTNNGPAAALDATITDTLPAGVTVTGTTTSQGSCSGTGPLTCNLGTMAPGAVATVGVTVMTASALPAVNPIMNTAAVTSTSADPEPANNSATQPTTIIARADVVLTKNGPATMFAGNNIAYTITVTNNGPSDALNVSVADPTPGGITFVSNTGDCTTAFPCALGTLAAGATRTITATYAVPSSYPFLMIIQNTATVTTDTTETDTTNNSGTQLTTVLTQADLAITKTGPATISAGNQITYTLTVTNNGPSDAAGVDVADPTPSGLTWVSNAGDCTTAFPCSLGALANGGTRTITATYLVPPGYTSPTPIVNIAAVSSSTSDSYPLNNSATASTTLGAPSANLSVTKTGPSTAIPGNSIAFTITVHNAGPADAADVALADPTPTGLSFVSNAGDCTTVFPCSLGTLPSGESRTITATYLVPPGYTTPDPIVNTATVSATTADPDPSDNTATAEVSVGADLSITKTATPEPVAAGSYLTFTIIATNGGARDAVDLVITDTIPAGTTFVSALPDTGGVCTLPSVGASGTVSCTWAGITTAAQVRVLTLTVRVDSGTAAGTVITNTATTTSSTNDPNLANNSATSTSNVVTAADIVITKTVDNPSPNVGDEVTYTVTARNDGPSHATGVAVTDAMPPSLEFVSSTPSQGTYDAPSGLWTIGALEDGASVTLQVRVRVTDDGLATNTATKTAGDQLDPDTSNNTAASSLTSNPVADVRVSKTADVTAPNVGSPVTFTIVASNAGPSDATGVRIQDVLPSGLTFVSATATSGSFDQASGIWELGALALNAEETLTLQATVNSAGPIVNEARKIALNELDPNPANDASGATVNGLAADIQVVKTVAASSDVRVGQQVIFFITATNNGPSAATGVRVRDLLPAGLAFVAATPTRGAYVPQTGVWDIGPLAATGAEATATLELRAVVLTHDTIVNRAALMSVDQSDLNPLNNESSVSLIAPTIDLADKITSPSNFSAVGSIADFYVEVTNVGGTTSVSPLTLAIPLPPEYDYVPEAQANWRCTQVARTLFCQYDIELPRGRGVTLKLPMRVNAPLPWGRSLFAHLTTPRDSVSPNNVTQLYLGVPPEPDPNMGAAQTVTVSGTGATRTLTYSVLVDNHGPLPAHNAVLTDVLPAGVTLVSADTTAGPCEVSGGFIACDLRTILPGHAVYATIVLNAPAPGAVTHTVSVSSDQFDEYPRDNQSVLTTKLEALADVDTDRDGMTDEWESLVGLSVNGADDSGDADGDGVSNLDEYRRGTHPRGTATRYFAEGASNGFFATTLSVFNPDRSAFASVMIELLQPDGSIVSAPRLLAPLGRVELDPHTLLPAGGTFSVLVESDRSVAVERDMQWDRSGYGSTGESGAPSASTSWYFAEGATGAYSLFYLIENPSMTESADVQVSYLLPGGRPPVVTTQRLAPHSRETIFVNSLAEHHPVLAAAEVAATIVSTNGVPIVAERAMYQDTPGQMMGAGHAGLGATAPSASWFFAEGATGAFFSEYLLLANPLATPAVATVRYLLPDGTSFQKPYDLLPLSRLTIDVAGEDARLAATSVAATVTATQPIVAERVMWWPGRTVSPTWYEAHASLGATVTGFGWAIAGGTSAGPFAARTYALVANQEPRAGQGRVTVSFDDGTTVERTIDLAPTSRTTVDFGVTFPETLNRHFSAVIDSIGASPVPVVVEWSRYGSPGGQFWAAGSAALATKVQ